MNVAECACLNRVHGGRSSLSSLAEAPWTLFARVIAVTRSHDSRLSEKTQEFIAAATSPCRRGSRKHQKPDIEHPSILSIHQYTVFWIGLACLSILLHHRHGFD